MLPQSALPQPKESKDLFSRLVESNKPFACIYRPLSDSKRSFLLLEGEVTYTHSLSLLSLDPIKPDYSSNKNLIASQLIILPFNQIAEKGFVCHDDNEPVIVINVVKQTRHNVNDWGIIESDTPLTAVNIHFDLSDESYNQLVKDIINDEINAGEGSNFVMSRSMEGDITNFSLQHALRLFNRLLMSERGSYWTWIVYTGDRFFIGSSPEQHIQVDGDRVSMNPISGTLKYPEKNIAHALYRFVNDNKERNELFMVVDEELKMMSCICDSDITVTGPQLKMMSRVAHTEYFIDGTSSRSLQYILQQSLFAPTVTGSPVENAAQVIKRREKRGRGYYSGVIGLIGTKDNLRYLDAAILIRAADITKDGHFRLTAGATIVRDSNPQNEAEETKAKLSVLMGSLFEETQTKKSKSTLQLPEHVIRSITTTLQQRNREVSSFWLGNVDRVNTVDSTLPSITLIDMEDTFTEMIAYQLRSIGHDVTIIPWHKSISRLPLLMEDGKTDILFMGPGPGDPNNEEHDKMVVGRALISGRLKQNLPLIGTCLGHQLICTEFGLPIKRLPKTRQGTQYKVTIEHSTYQVGFYNSFAGMHKLPHWVTPKYNRLVYLERLGDQEIVALKSDNVASIQFHNESFLTTNAFPIYHWMIYNSLGDFRKEKIAGT
ncbi:chorismate-binding protein [Xenorhabdus sp. XENO-7]|uniref:anthranilate synthase n=1 Tax=Xenorhabdus aichiensis TaxID=3025874 RepID=A0ABT5M510_9GAMM|nr:chorismate-binding protein [Xenorhabdus aichiensis]MDC9622018.1 chorismate-binding protein [Xenorhabdus aichiensis]